MTVETKYANLPWIARDETDVYETEDLPESEQTMLQTDSSSIERIVISHDDAKKVFIGKNLNADNVDFSDRIREFVNTGYSIDTTEYVLYPDAKYDLETPLQRFQRLNSEVRDLIDDFEQVKQMTQRNADEQLSNNELLSMGRDLESMTHQLGCYKLHYTLGDENAVDVALDSDLCGQDSREMLEEIERYAAKHKSNDSGTDRLAWEKYYRSPASKELDNAKITDLNARVQRLQSILGSHEHREPNITALNTETSTTSLVEAARILMSRTQPLKGGPNMDKLETRLVAVQTRLQSITEHRDAVSEADRQNKVAELYGLVVRWREMREVLPVLVARLEELHRLHGQAMNFVETVRGLEEGQAAVRAGAARHKELLCKLEAGLSERVARVRSGIAAVQKRVAAL